MSRPLPPRTLLLILLVALVVFGILYYAASSVNKAFGAVPAQGKQPVGRYGESARE